MAIDPHQAARTGRVDDLRAYIEDGGDVNTPGHGQLLRTPLHMAIETNHVEAARLLLDLGADVNALDYRKKGPLHYAAGVGIVELVELLLERGANPNSLDTFGENALHSIASGGGLRSEQDQVRIVHRLMAAGLGADSDGNAGRTPLWYAAARAKLAVAKALLDAGANPNKRANGELGTPRDAAKGNPVEKLLS
jgi:cytochrome c